MKTAMLECGCTKSFEPPAQFGQEVWCLRHERATTVVHDGWSYKCENCGRHVPFGESPVTCATKAAAHAIGKGRNHVVHISHNGKFVRTVGGQKTQNVLFPMGEE